MCINWFEQYLLWAECRVNSSWSHFAASSLAREKAHQSHTLENCITQVTIQRVRTLAIFCHNPGMWPEQFYDRFSTSDEEDGELSLRVTSVCHLSPLAIHSQWRYYHCGSHHRSVRCRDSFGPRSNVSCEVTLNPPICVLFWTWYIDCHQGKKNRNYYINIQK